MFGPGIDEPLVWCEGPFSSGPDPGDRRFLHADERGSIVAVSDGTGAMLNVNKYDEFGTPGSANAGRFQYTGQMWLPEIGLYHYKARAYAPHLGRFLETDPIGYAAGPNLYAYVLNDPVNLADPKGLCTATLWGRFLHNEDWSVAILQETWVTLSGCGGGSSGGSSPAAPGTGGGGKGGTRDKEPQCPTDDYSKFIREQYIAALPVSVNYDVGTTLLLGLSSWESGHGTSLMYTRSNNPFGATPGGDATRGVRYPSFHAAWQRWGVEWGPRVAGVGSNAGAFVSRLLIDNRFTTGGVDQRGPYNTQNVKTGGDPGWSEGVLGTIEGVEKRFWDAFRGC